MRYSISIIIFASLFAIVIPQSFESHHLEKYGSIKIDNCLSFHIIDLDISDFDLDDKIYIKVLFYKKVKEDLIFYEFSDSQGDNNIYNYLFDEGKTYPLTFKKPGTSDFYYNFEKSKNSHYLNIIIDCDGGKYKIENTKFDEGYWYCVIIIFLIVFGGLSIIAIICICKCKTIKADNKLRNKSKNSFRLQANAQNQQPVSSVTVKNNEQQNIETNQNEARLSLNNNFNKNDINIIPTIQNTENEIIRSNENLQEKK